MIEIYLNLSEFYVYPKIEYKLCIAVNFNVIDYSVV